MDKALDKISLYKMRIFNTIIKCNSMKAASRHLSIPYSSLMLEIRRLEKALGAILLVKDKKRTVLTEDGEKFSAFSQEFLDRFNEQNFADLSSNNNEITIASTYGMCEVHITTIIKKLCGIMPSLKINLMAGGEFMDFTSHDCDIVLGPKLTNRPDLSQKYITTFDYYLYANSEYLNKYGTPKNIDDLSNHKLMIFNRELSNYDDILPLDNVFIESTSYRSLFNLVESGHGIAPVTDDQIKNYSSKESNLIKLFPDYICERNKYYFLYRKHSDKITIIDKVFELAYSVFNETTLESAD